MTVERCPCCQQVLRSKQTTPAQICYDCGNPIIRGHRFTYQQRRGETAVVHRVCSNPESYYRAADCKRRGVVGYKHLSKEQIAEATAREDELEAHFAQWRRDNGKG